MKNKFKTRYLFITLFVLQCFPLLMNGQVTFQKNYPTALDQSGKDVLATSDGGYIIASTTENDVVNDLDVLITKTNNIGDTVWTRTYHGGDKPEYPNCILQTNDGFLIAGYSQSNGGGDQDVYLLKINASGDSLWTKFYGGWGNEEGKEIVATTDGNFVIVGGSNSVNFSNNDMLLIKISPAGTAIWTKYYGSDTTYESARSVKLCQDEGFILAGKTASIPNAKASIYLVKTNSAGDTLWTKTYSGGTNSYEGKFVLANSDGTYTLCADDSSGTHDSDVRLMNISSSGDILWNKSYGGTDKDITKMIQPTTDGGYIVAAISRSFGWSNPDMWLLKINTSGDTLWTRHFGGAGHEHCTAARQTDDGGYIAIGHTRSFGVIWKIMFVKLNDLGNIVDVSPLALNNTTFNIYPNPARGKIHIDLSDARYSQATFRISNSLGQILFSETIDPASGIKNKEINLENKNPGIYFITMQTNDHITTKKLVLN